MGRSQPANQALTGHPLQRDAHRRRSQAANAHNGRISEPIKVYLVLAVGLARWGAECPLVAISGHSEGHPTMSGYDANQTFETAGSGPDSSSPAMFATLPVTESGHPETLG